MFLATGCLILAAGIYMFKNGRNKTGILKKYEKENLLEDGTFYFVTVHASREHQANRNLYRVITALGFFTSLFGLIFIGYGLNIFTYPT